MAADLVIGVMGQASLPDLRPTRAILADLVEGRNVHFILSLHYPLGDAVKVTRQFIDEGSCTYDIILDETTPEGDDEVNAFVEGAEKSYSVLRATNKLTNLLGEALDAGVEAVLYCGYVNDDPAEMTEAGKDSYHALKRCSQKGIPLFDIADGEQWEPLSEEEIRNGPQVPVEATDNLPEGEDGEEDEEEPEADAEEEVVIDLSEVPEDPSVWKVRAARDYLKDHRIYTGEERRGAENRWKRRVGAMNLKTTLDWLYPVGSEELRTEEPTLFHTEAYTSDRIAGLSEKYPEIERLAADIRAQTVDPDNIVVAEPTHVLPNGAVVSGEDTIVGRSREEMEAWAEDRKTLVLGHPSPPTGLPPGVVNLNLAVDLREMTRAVIEDGDTVEQYMLRLVVSALK